MSLISDLKAGLAGKTAPASAKPCRVCGWAPAAPATFTTFARLYYRPRLGRREGPFCRDCGIAMFRAMTARALPGWWYPFSFFVVPFLVAGNLIQLRRVVRMAPPASQGPAVSAGVRALARLSGAELPQRDKPLPVGPPLYRRWQMIGVLAPVVGVAVIILLAAQT
jgi:hypothetical protein